MDKRGKIVVGILSGLLAALLIVAVLSCYGYDLAIGALGFEKDSVHILDDYLVDGVQYRVVMELRHDEMPRVVLLENRFLGFWTRGKLSDAGALKNAAFWSYYDNTNYYILVDDLYHAWEVHEVYYGKNAAGLIRIPADKLPAGVGVEVLQAGRAYAVHLVNYGTGSVADLDIPRLLTELGCTEN